MLEHISLRVGDTEYPISTVLSALGVSDIPESIKLVLPLPDGEGLPGGNMTVGVYDDDDSVPGIDAEYEYPKTADTVAIPMVRAELSVLDNQIYTFLYAGTESYVAYCSPDTRPAAIKKRTPKDPAVIVSGDMGSIVQCYKENARVHFCEGASGPASL